MAKNTRTTVIMSPGHQTADVEEFALTPEVSELLAEVDALLEKGHAKHALDIISRAKSNSPWAANAAGVCQLRLGTTKAATDIYRRLLLSSVGATIREDAPTVFKTNYATSLLAEGNLQGCLLVLADVKRDPHPAVQKLRSAIERSRQKLSFWGKLQWYTGLRMTYPVDLDFPLGDLQ